MSGFVELLVLLFLHKIPKLFDAGSILTIVPTFPSGLVMVFGLKLFFSLVECGHFPNLL